MHVTGLHIHPVKSLRGLAVEAAGVDALGLAGDRRFLVVEPDGTFMTQRGVPRMARVGAFLDGSLLTLRAEGFGEIRVRRDPDPGAPEAVVRIWKSEGLRAEDCGEAPASWLSSALATPCRLVRIGAQFNRPVRADYANPGDAMAFADAFPLLVISEASLGDLNRRMAEAGGAAVPMNRFRPNLVVAGCEAFAEDGLGRFRIGNVVFRAAKPCIRCIVPTTDQLTGERGVEPMRTLALYRRDPHDPAQILFGYNLVNETKTGVIRVGDTVEILN
ncbi:MAG TPA: MOSC N-terminal beta barrel domain-containing protein [Opitutaceae bacterium]|nr:MOSC N-terminal beta barrel domain-containing protein [Opitutaceae bacterium]